MRRSIRFPLPLLALSVALGAIACGEEEPACGSSSCGSQAGSSQGGAAAMAGTGAGGTAATGGSMPSGGEGNSVSTGGASGSSTGGASGADTGGASGASTGGVGGTTAGDAGSTAGGMGGGGAATGGVTGTGGNGGAPGGAGNGGAGGQPSGALTITLTDGLWTGVRYYTGSTPANRTSGPAQGPSQTYRIHNGGTASASVTATVSGDDAARFQITAPASFPASVAANADLDVTLRLVTASTTLGTAPAQDDGATVLEGTLTATAGSATARSRLYALVLTYVELEPTFGQILNAFPEYTSNLPNAIRNDANPNPATLPGVEAGTDEVRAPAFRRANASAPVTLRAIGRFSPPGLVPFGWYQPGSIAGRTTVATLAQATDAHTNDKSRMLLPPLASGNTSFEPSATTFGLWMAPAGVGLLATEDAQGFDGAHRCKVWTLRDAGGTVRPNEFLIGGEEAANGDYQDYVFIVTNVVPVP